MGFMNFDTQKRDYEQQSKDNIKWNARPRGSRPSRLQAQSLCSWARGRPPDDSEGGAGDGKGGREPALFGFDIKWVFFLSTLEVWEVMIGV